MSTLIKMLKILLAPFLRRRGFLKAELELRADGLKRFFAYEEQKHRPRNDAFDLKQLKITIVIPDFQIGAGGHMTIFRMAHLLEKFGHEVDFLIQNPTVHQSAEAAHRTINDHFQPFGGTVELMGTELPILRGDALIATDRFTCYPVRAMGGFIRKFYLVQDYEPYFYPVGPEFLLSEQTYRFDFDCLCAGEWLSGLMAQKYDRWSMSWPLAYDPDIYHDDILEQSRTKNRIAFYARYVTPRRAVELAFIALEILHKRGVEFEVDFFGWDIGGQPKVGYKYKNHGVLNGSALAELYRKAAIGLVFSATNHSLVNKEMMACALPVVDLDRENVRAIFPDNVLAFTAPDPEKIADTLQDLLEDDEKRIELGAAGLDYVADFSWEKSARLIEAALQERIGHFASGKDENA